MTALFSTGALVRWALLLGAIRGGLARQASVVKASDQYTKLQKHAHSWSVEQQGNSCGMVWFSQTSYARSKYRITQVADTFSCAANHQVLAEIVRIPEGSLLSQRFTDICAGVMPLLDSAQHIDLATGSSVTGSLGAIASSDTQHASASLITDDTVFLLVRNDCSSTVTVTVTHDVDILLILPLAALRMIVQAVSVIVVGGLIAWCACTANSYRGAAPQTANNQRQEDSLPHPLSRSSLVPLLDADAQKNLACICV